MTFLEYVGTAALYALGIYALLVVTILVISKKTDGLVAVALIGMATKWIGLAALAIGLIWFGHIL